MLKFTTGDILQADAEALVNTVNCVGIMGRGVALQFKKRFPDNFKAYAAACKRGEVQPGRMFVHEMGSDTAPRYIVNFPTKRHWRGNSRIEDIEAGLDALRAFLRENRIKSVALPPLGSGLGRLDWQQVRTRIERTLGPVSDTQITVYEPNPAMAERPQKTTKPPTMTAGRAALVGLVRRYLSGLLDPFVTLLEVHKLMYFLQVAGEPLRLKFTQGLYGPYAENLRHVLRRVEGYYLTGFTDDGDSPSKDLQLVPGAVEDARKALKTMPATLERIQRVSDLVDGFETPFGLELLSTVLWIAQQKRTLTPAEIIAGVYAWNDRKLQFTERQIRLALRVLDEKGWLTAQQSA